MTGFVSRRRAVGTLLLACALALVAGFGGPLFAPLDSLSHFRVHLGVLVLMLALGALALRLRVASLAGALVAVAALATSLPYMPGFAPASAAGAQGPGYTLLQMNLLYKADDRADAIRRIGEARPDIVTVQETTAEWVATFEALRDTYPHQFFCREGNRIDAGILSRRPFLADGFCDARNALAAQSVDFNGRTVTVVSHHQLWPWPAGQWRRLGRIEPTLDALPGPILLGGDFNAVPWSAIVRRYEAALGVEAVRGIGPTWGPVPGVDALARWFGLPIDNVLHSPEIEILSAERLQATTSDHLPVLVRFVLPVPSGVPEPETAMAGLSAPAE